MSKEGGASLQDVAGVESDLLSPSQLSSVAKAIGTDWKNLGRDMDFVEAELQSFTEQYRYYGLQEMAYQMLLSWMMKNENATTFSLRKHLESIKRKDIITSVLDPSNRSISSTVSSAGCTFEEIKRNLVSVYQTLTMTGFPWMRDISLTLKHYYASLTLTKINSKGQHTDQSIRIEDMFDSADGKMKATRIHAEGGPGLGKSTLAAKLAFDWATEQSYMRNFDLVFLVPLRQFTGDLHETLSAAAGIHNEKQSIAHILQSKKVLILFDGYDEASTETQEEILPLLQRKVYAHISVMVTSRPGRFFSQKSQNTFLSHSDYRPTCSVVWDKRITVDGLDEEQQKSFVDRHMEGYTETKKSIVRRKLAKMVDKKFLSCPLFLLMLTIVFSDDHHAGKKDTKTDIYKHVFNYVFRRYISRRDSEIPVAELDLFSWDNKDKSTYFNLMIQFSRLALWAIKTNRLSFSRSDITETCNCDPEVLDLGFLTSSIPFKGMRQTVLYEPVHKSLLEFGAAFWLLLRIDSDFSSEWKGEVTALRPKAGTAYSSLCFPFLMGLMGDKADILVELLIPFAAEYSQQFDSLWVTLRETQLTNSVLSQMKSLMPVQWCISEVNGNSDFFTFPQHEDIVRWITQHGTIQTIRWDISVPARLPTDVKFHTLILDVDENWLVKQNGESVYQFCNYMQGRLCCQDLVCNIARYVNESFLYCLEGIEFSRMSFSFDCEFLREIDEFVSHGKLETVPIYRLKLQPYSQNLLPLEIACQFIKKENVEALEVDLGSYKQSDAALVDKLIASASDSTHLTYFIMKSTTISNQSENDFVEIDFPRLCSKPQTSWEWMQLQTRINVRLRESVNDIVFVRHLDASLCNIQSPRKSFLRSFHAASLTCCSSLLDDAENDWPISNSLTELNVVVDKSFVECGLSCLAIKFQNLKILTLTMKPFDYGRLSCPEDLLLGVHTLVKLKELQVWDIEENAVLTKDLLKGVFQCFENCKKSRSEMPSSEDTTVVPQCESTLHLNCITLNCRSTHVLGRDCFVQLKKCLMENDIERLDIVPYVYEGYKSKHHRDIKISSFLSCFPSKEGFRVVHDLWGSRSEDSIYSKGMFNLAPGEFDRWSITFSKM